MRRAISSLVIGFAIVAVVIAGRVASAGIPQEPPGGDDEVACDKVTGGGYIVGAGSASPDWEPSYLKKGAKANFGVGGGVKNGAFWGHLEYNDHSASPPVKVHGTGVTNYFAPDGVDDPHRVIIGTAKFNGVGGYTYMIEVADNGEPGRGIDEFSIEVFLGEPVPANLVYQAGTNYGDGPIRGGNIQLHSTCSGTPPPDKTCQMSEH